MWIRKLILVGMLMGLWATPILAQTYQLTFTWTLRPGAQYHCWVDGVIVVNSHTNSCTVPYPNPFVRHIATVVEEDDTRVPSKSMPKGMTALLGVK